MIAHLLQKIASVSPIPTALMPNALTPNAPASTASTSRPIPRSPHLQTSSATPPPTLQTRPDQEPSPRPSFSTSALKLKDILGTITAKSCPHSYNFHMHTLCSDGSLQPEALIEQAIAIGLKGLAITDHHSVDGFVRADQWLSKWRSEWRSPQPDRPAITLWSGIEITARLLESNVHILGYGFDVRHSALCPYLQGESVKGTEADVGRVIDTIHGAGGIAVLAHPHRYKQPAALLVPEATRYGIDGIEAYYAYDYCKPWRPSPNQTHLTEQLATDFGLLKTCGTDSHGLSLLHRR